MAGRYWNDAKKEWERCPTRAFVIYVVEILELIEDYLSKFVEDSDARDECKKFWSMQTFARAIAEELWSQASKNGTEPILYNTSLTEQVSRNGQGRFGYLLIDKQLHLPSVTMEPAVQSKRTGHFTMNPGEIALMKKWFDEDPFPKKILNASGNGTASMLYTLMFVQCLCEHAKSEKWRAPSRGKAAIHKAIFDSAILHSVVQDEGIMFSSFFLDESAVTTLHSNATKKWKFEIFLRSKRYITDVERKGGGTSYEEALTRIRQTEKEESAMKMCRLTPSKIAQLERWVEGAADTVDVEFSCFAPRHSVAESEINHYCAMRNKVDGHVDESTRPGFKGACDKVKYHCALTKEFLKVALFVKERSQKLTLDLAKEYEARKTATANNQNAADMDIRIQALEGEYKRFMKCHAMSALKVSCALPTTPKRSKRKRY